MFVTSSNQPFVRFVLSAEFTDLLTVEEDEDFAVYNYGIKMCSDGEMEDTLFVVNSDYGQLNNIIVYPKLVEGV